MARVQNPTRTRKGHRKTRNLCACEVQCSVSAWSFSNDWQRNGAAEVSEVRLLIGGWLVSFVRSCGLLRLWSYLRLGWDWVAVVGNCVKTSDWCSAFVMGFTFPRFRIRVSFL